MGLRDSFRDWKAWTKHRVKQRRRDIRKAAREARLGYEQEMANKDFAKWNLDKWKKHWDDFNDLHYWVHDTTGESTYEEPDIEIYQPKGWVEPDPPDCMKDEHTGELLSPRSLRQREADTPSDHSVHGGTDEDSDEAWKEERGMGGEGESDSEEDDAVSGMVPKEGEGAVVLADVPVITEEGEGGSGVVGFANEDDVKTGEGQIVARPSTSQGMIVRGEVGGVMVKSTSRDFVGVKAEQDAAAARVFLRRKQQIKRRMQKEGLQGEGGGEEKESAVHKAIAAKEAEEAERNRVPTEHEVMIMAGWDPAGNYSNKELDAFGKKALKINKTLGRTANGGVGSLTGEHGENYGRYEPDMVTGFFAGRAEAAKVAAMLAGQRAAKYGSKAKAGVERDNEPTGLGTVFSRQGKRFED